MIDDHLHDHWSMSEGRFIQHSHPHRCNVTGFNRLHHHAPQEHMSFTEEQLRKQEGRLDPLIKNHAHEHWSPAFDMYLSHSHPHVCINEFGRNHHHDPKDHESAGEEGVFETRRILGEMYS